MEQTKINSDSIENLVAEGVVENVQDKDEQTESVDKPVQ